MSVMRYMGQTYRAFTLYRDEALGDLGLSGYKGTYLNVIHHNPGITQEMLAEKLVFNKSSVARQIAELEEKGFVRRERCSKDKRQFRVYSTPEGEAVLEKVRAVSKEFLSYIQEEFTDEEMAQFNELCIRLCHRAKEAIRGL